MKHRVTRTTEQRGTTSSHPLPPHHPTHRPVHHGVRTYLVCLPAHLHPTALIGCAEARLGHEDLHPHGPMPHFIPARRSRQLVNPWRDTAAGGPIGQLDLPAMRARAQAAASAQWQVWRDVVDGTRPARPYWAYAERHRADPRGYPIQRAQHDYLDQPRILAMRTYSLRSDRICDLDGTHLEAFQAGHITFATLAAQAAVPADGIATNSGPGQPGWIAPTSGRLNDLLNYLNAANTYLAWLPPRTNIVAMATPL